MLVATEYRTGKKVHSIEKNWEKELN